MGSDFSDEFNIDGAVDSKKWNYTPRGDVAHAYYYKPNDTSVVWCEDGLLNLKFMKDETDPADINLEVYALIVESLILLMVK